MKFFRITIYVANSSIVGKWRRYNEAEFLEACKANADNDVMFTVEFSDTGN